MKTLVLFCLRRPITTLMIHLTLVLLGVIAVTRLPLNSMPNKERPVINVTVSYPNANPNQAETEVTKKLEEVLATLRGVRSMSSNSEAGEARVTLRFDWGANLDSIKVDVRERLARIRSELPIADLDSIRITGARRGGNAIIKGRIAADGVDLSENYDLLLDRIQRPLERIEGVSQVKLEGVTPREIHIEFRQADLDRFALNVDTIMTRLQEQNSNLSVGELLEGGRVSRMRVISGFANIDDVRRFPLTANGLRLEQVAEVRMMKGEIRFGRHLNGAFAVSIEVFKESNANTVETCKRIKETVAKLSDDPLLSGSGIRLLLWEDQGQAILDSLDGLKNAGVIGSLLALLILYLFLRRGSATLLVGMTIPISVFSALAWLYLLDKELNIITIVALMLGVGMLVDTAVVVVESIVRLSGGGMDTEEAAEQGTLEVATPIFAATLTSIIVFIPVAFGPSSQLGDYLKELGLVISLTLASSLFVSLTLIPMVSMRIYKRGERSTGWVLGNLSKFYSKLLGGALARPMMTLVFASVVIFSVVLPFQKGFQIDLDDKSEIEKNVSVFFRPQGSYDYLKMEKYVNQVEAVIDKHRERLGVADVYSWYKDNFAWTALYPSKALTEEQMALLRKEVDEILPTIPGVSVQTGDWGMFWGRRGSRSAGTQQVKVSGESVDTISRIIEDLREQLVGVPGVLATEVKFRDSVDEVTVIPDPTQLDRAGMSSAEFSGDVQSHFSGRRLREIRTAEGEMSLRIVMNEDERNSLRELEDLNLFSDSGAAVSLSELGAISINKGAGELRRENRQSTRTVSVQFDPSQLAQAKPVLAAVLANYVWPSGYGYELGGGRRQRQANNDQFSELMLLAIFLVFMVMACLFESLMQPLIVMTTVALAFPGVIWGLYLSGDKMDQPAAIGLVLLAGIVVNNGIVLVDHVNRYRKRGLEIREALLRGGADRLRPILITALTTIIGLIPMAYSAPISEWLVGIGLPISTTGAAQAAGTYYFTLARTIVGGLAMSTLLTLLVLPVFYLMWARVQMAMTSRKREPSYRGVNTGGPEALSGV